METFLSDYGAWWIWIDYYVQQSDEIVVTHRWELAKICVHADLLDYSGHFAAEWRAIEEKALNMTVV